MKIALGSDRYGFDLKTALASYLESCDHQIQDMGTHHHADETLYYKTAMKVAVLVSQQKVDRGILCCGTGMGMAIIANKFLEVYAAVCENRHAAEKSRSINNSNILTLGGLFTTPFVGQEIVEAWLNTEFTQNWDPEIQVWLAESMQAIAQAEEKLFHPASESETTNKASL